MKIYLGWVMTWHAYAWGMPKYKLYTVQCWKYELGNHAKFRNELKPD